MSSKHLIDPEILPALALLPSVAFSSEVIKTVREELAALPATDSGAVPLEVEVYEAKIRTRAGHEIAIVIHVPREAAAARPALLHIHGGGYVVGTARMSTPANQALALQANCVVVSVDYRLAPETPHPGPIEDCYAALTWLHDNATALNVDATRIAVAGESAGGGLAAALALLARDRGEVKLIHQHLTYPMLDDRTCIASTSPYVGEFVWMPASNRFGWSSLLGCEPGGEDVSPYAAAARAEDLSGLPSTFISVGALDLFSEENLDYARRLIRAGVPTELHVYPGAFHAFDLALEAQVTKKALENSLSALRRALHPASS